MDQLPVSLDVYVWDEKGNSLFCTVALTLVGCDDLVNPGSMIAGSIQTIEGTDVDQVHVSLSTNPSELNKEMMSTTEGYAFESNTDGLNYDIVAERNTDYMYGISTLDLVLIQRHILQFKKFDNAYTLFAADINNDATINALDLIQLRQLILGKIDVLPSNTSWLFGNATQEFGELDEVLEEGLVTVIDVDVLNDDMMHENFVAQKVGDVNNTVSNLLSGLDSDVRTNNVVTIDLQVSKQ